MNTTAVILVGAGRGLRAGGALPKQWQDLGGKPVAARTLALFSALPAVSRIVMVLHPDDFSRVAGWQVEVVAGGASRAQSVKAGLEHLASDPPDRVLIHDLARPNCPQAVIAAVLAALDGAKGAAPGLPLSDTLWQESGGMVSGQMPREHLFRAQTPQGFHFAEILAAHREFGSAAATDDVAVALAAGLAVAIVPGDEANLKITLPGDFARVKAMLKGHDMRTGSGFDIHRLTTGDHVTLGGLRIAAKQGIEAHSDGDVVLHALSDALYGAIAEGDIGQHFPPNEPDWKGADSRIFLAHAAARVALRGYRVANCDVTILAEAPKIAPHTLVMRQRIAEILGVRVDQVSIKATTMEKLGPIGAGEGIAAQASVLLVGA